MNEETEVNGNSNNQIYQYPQYQEDEISLVDIWLVLMRRKRVVAFITVLFIIAGLAFWATKTRKKLYTTSIEIGNIITKDDTKQPIEAREAVETRLRNTILPDLRNQLANKFEKNVNDIPKMQVEIPEEEETGNFVFLETKIVPRDQEINKALHQGVIDRLSSVHDRIFDVYKKRFQARLSKMEVDLQELKDKQLFQLRELKAEARLENAINALEEKKEAFPIKQQKREHNLEQKQEALEMAKIAFEVEKQSLEHKIRRTEENITALRNQKKRLKARMKRISIEENLYRNQLDDIHSWMNNAKNSQESLYKSVKKDTNLALAALMLGNQAENARKQFSEVQRRLSIQLPEKRSQLEEKIEEKERKILETQEKVSVLKSQLDKLKKDHTADINKRKREIAQLKNAIEKAASDHKRAVESAKKKIEQFNVELKELQADHQRKIERKKQEIELFKTEGERMTATTAPAAVVPSKTIGRGGAMIGALSLCLGLMVGVFGAFFREFLAIAKERAWEQGETDKGSRS